MTDDPDNAKISSLHINLNQNSPPPAQAAPVNVEAETLYAQYVKQAKVTDLSHVAKSNVIYKGGKPSMKQLFTKQVMILLASQLLWLLVETFLPQTQTMSTF